MDGLILGIDICNEYSHLSFYDKSKNVPESVPFAGEMALANPDVLDRMTAQPARLAGHVAEIMQTAYRYCACNETERVCVTIPHFERHIVDAVRDAFISAGVPDTSLMFISHEECLAYYAFGMHRDLWINGVILIDYSYDGITGYRMDRVAIGSKQVIAESDYMKDENRVLTDEFAQSKGAADLDMLSDILTQDADKLIGKKAASSVYLTGRGFDTTRLPDAFLKCICNRHRVFAGQNLYVKGACICAFTEANALQRDVIVACRNRLPSTIDMDIIERGKMKIFRIASAGTNWYHAGRSVDFIADDCSSITLHIQPAGGQKPYDEIVDFSDFPYRAGKTTRINVRFEFEGDDRCSVTVTDKGFGCFVQASGKSVVRSIDL